MSDIVAGKELSGRRIDLPGGRYVFVGRHPKYPEGMGFVFCNQHGGINSFRLTPDALQALKQLLTDDSAGVKGHPLPPMMILRTYLVTLATNELEEAAERADLP